MDKTVARSFFKKKRYYIFVILFAGIISFLLNDPVLWDERNYSKAIYDTNGTLIRAYLNKDEQWCFPLSQNEISEKLITAAVTYEDEHFFQHFGINPFAILRAIKQNISHRKIVSGASTITMQLMRITNPKKRSYWNKFIEVLQAIRTEIFYSKLDILKYYFERAPYGSNIIGVKAAARKYFLKEPAQLSWGQAAALAVLPNAPGIIYPGKSQAKFKKKRDQLLKKLFENEEIDKLTLELALQESLPGSIFPLQQKANHFCDYIQYQTTKRSIHTTLDLKIQNEINIIANQYKHYLYSRGIQNLAILVVETKTQKVRAYLGSQNYWNLKILGRNDGVQAKRSSGSILKPFLYAGAIHKGMILPSMKIEDTYVAYDGFIPQNYNHKYNGMVSVQEALVKSLNVPAIKILEEYRVEQFYETLENFGFSTLFRTPAEYGLSLIIGGAEVTLWDLVQGYCTMGNYGHYKPISALQNDKRKKESKVLDKGSIYLTLKMLEDVKRPGLYEFWERFTAEQSISWKTGTSFGHRDAWAVGTTPEWTIGVWCGNFDGVSNKDLVGAKAAGPLLFQCFEALQKETKSFAKPEKDLEIIEICGETGYPMNMYCEKENSRFVYRPKTEIMYPNCPYCEPVEVDLEAEFEVCSKCWETGKHKTKTYTAYSPTTMKILRKQKTNFDFKPVHNPTCEYANKTAKIEIISPANNARLWLPILDDGRRQSVLLEAQPQNNKQTLFWYVDDLYLGKTTRQHKIKFFAKSGVHNLTIIDDCGNTVSQKFEIL